jgi:hypothetical protein
MDKSIAAKADEILGGALSNPRKNPYDTKTGVMMDPKDTLLDLPNDTREQMISEMARIDETGEEPLVEAQKSSQIVISEQEFQILQEAKKIIKKIEKSRKFNYENEGDAGKRDKQEATAPEPKTKTEATTAGMIGVNMAGPGLKPRKKKKSSSRKSTATTDFISYLRGK